MKRRDFLKSVVISSATALTGGFSLYKIGDSEKNINLIYNIEQLSVESNQRFNQSFNSDGCCYIISYPSELVDIYNSNPTRFNKDYGEYKLSLDNTLRLIEYLNKHNKPTIFVIGENDLYNENIPQEFQPFNSAFILVTKDGFGELLESITTKKGKEKQNPNSILSYLIKSGVKELRFGGESFWWRGGKGKLVEIAIFFNNHFEIKGIDGCMYPVTLSSDNEIIRNDKILRKLYENRVSLEDILKN